MIDSPHVVLQTLHHTPLDEFALIVYFGAFYVFALVTFRRPVFGLAGLILVEPFALYRDVGPTTLTLPKVALAGLAIGLLLRRVPVNRLLDRNVLPILAAAAAIAAATFLSYPQAEFKAPVIREGMKAVEYLLVFAVSVLCFRIDPDESVLRRVLFLVGLLVSLLAIAQEFTNAPAGMWIANHAVPRIAGPLEGPNQLSGYLGLLLPVMAAYVLTRRARIVEVGIFGIVVCAELLTLSRAGVGSAIVAIAFTAFALRDQLNARRAVSIAIPVLIGLVAVAMVGGEVSHFWSTKPQFQPSGLGTRAELWTGAYRLWLQHPFLGIGAGNYEFELGRVGFPGVHTHSNSGYIQATVEGGIPLLLAVIAATWFSLATFLRRSQSGSGGVLIAGVLGAAAGMALHEAFDFLLFFPKVGVLYWILLGVGAATCSAGSDFGRNEAGIPAAPGPKEIRAGIGG